MVSLRNTPVTDALDAQGTLQPGTEGYWKVWGARASDIRPGDLVMVKNQDNVISEYEVLDYAPRGREGTMMDLIRPRFRAPAKSAGAGTGQLFSVGAMQAVVVLRKGTHHTLAESVR